MKLNNNDDSHNSGLNLLIYNMLLDIESHPAWVCGLKLSKNGVDYVVIQSHPAWVCGLKHYRQSYVHCLEVTPCVGVWIETSMHRFLQLHLLVTPCVGVWIETYNARIVKILHESHPAWVCGLKQPVPQTSHSNLLVTPCVGVWIETSISSK